ncbi:MAG: hypothetical protein R2939_22385, partial [Kofleriaceae bacterium]
AGAAAARGAELLTAESHEAGFDEAYDPADVRVGPLRPRWRGGALAAEVPVVGDTCYACSRGDAGSYEVGLWVDAPVPSAWRDALPELPAAVVAALAAADVAGVSWGQADPRWATVFAAE